MNGSQTVIVLGGGIGGVAATVDLRNKLPDRYRVVLVNRRPEHVFAPSLPWLITGARTAERITGSLRKLERRGIEVVFGEVERIDPEQRSVVVDGSALNGDRIVVSLGADLDDGVVPGLSGAGHNFYSLEGAESLKRALEGFRSGRLVVMTAEPVYKCPAAPYEVAMLLESHLRRSGVRDGVQVDMYAAEPGPMGVAGPEVSAAVRGMVERKGIGYHPEHKVAEVDADGRKIHFDGGSEAEFDLLAYVSPHRAPKVVRDAGLTGESGWVPVDRHTLETESPGVYAIGDVTTIPLSMGKPLPKAGVFAHAEAKVVARNVAADMLGKVGGAGFDGQGPCFVEIGDGRAALVRGDFYAEPTPKVKLHRHGRHWHLGKALLERKWLRPLS